MYGGVEMGKSSPLCGIWYLKVRLVCFNMCLWGFYDIM